MKRKIALLLAVVMILSLVPMMSFAAGTVTASVPAVGKVKVADGGATLGNINMVLPAGSITDGEFFYLDLSNDAVFPGTVGATVYAQTSTPTGFGIRVSPGQFGEVNAMDVASFTKISGSRVRVDFTANVEISDPATVIFVLRGIDTSASSNGAINATVVATPGSPFPTGATQVATVGDSSDVTLETGSTKESNDGFTFNLKVKEDNPGAIENNSTIRLELPAGFKWDTSTNPASLPITAGPSGTTTPWYYEQYGTNMKDNIEFLRVSDSVLEIKFTRTTSAVTSFEIRRLSFSVDDSSKIKEGDITAKVRTTGIRRNTSDLKIGTYGEYGARIVVEDDVPTIFSGQIGQEVVTMIVKETISNSLIQGRDIELVLPSYAKWTDADGSYSDEDLKLDVKTTIRESNPNRTLRVTVTGNAKGDPATIELEEYEVAVEPGFAGDLVVEVRGAGMDAHEIVIAKVVEPVVMESKNAPTVIIGRADQNLGDIVITESAEEAFLRDGSVSLVLPQGVRFTKAPVVKVTDGDLVIEHVSTTSNSNYVSFDIDRQSYEASEITISDVYVTVDRTVPEGNITAELTGTGIINTNVDVKNSSGAVVIDARDYWSNSNTAAEVVIAKVGTPAPGEIGRDEVSLTIGVVPEGGDVAPYLANNRTYAPVSAVAQALGISKNNIIWNEANRTVTVLGDKTVQMTIGSTDLLVNGTLVPMDAAPEITSSRTFLPISWLAKALDVEYSWDAATQTVTFY